MNPAIQKSPPAETHRTGNAMALALRLAHAENALNALTSGQIDAIVNVDGQTYLLRAAQEQLRQSEAYLSALIASVPDVLTVVGRAGMIISQSSSVRQAFNYDPEELVGHNFFELVHRDDLEPIVSAFHHVAQGFEVDSPIRFRYRACDGAYRTVEATLGKFQDGSSEKVVFSLRPEPATAPERAQRPLADATASPA